MATVEECRTALTTLAGRLAAAHAEAAAAGRRRQTLDRALSCRVTDLGVDFHGRLAEGTLRDIQDGPDPRAQIVLTSDSDDLVSLTEGRLNVASAFSSGRIKIKASPFDLLKLRAML